MDPSPWRASAACRGLDPNLFFPKTGTSNADALAVCAGCPVRSECGEEAMANRERYGIYGGMSERTRRSKLATRLGANRRPGPVKRAS